jgi:Ca2+-transporting ATPase
MQDTVITSQRIRGLSAQQVPSLQKEFGKNIFKAGDHSRFLRIVFTIVKEPMFILLVIACSLYFILGSIAEGMMMVAAILLVTAISLYQEVKSSRALEALKQLTEPHAKVIRDNKEMYLPIEELVPGDIILLEEGMKVPADAILLEQNDLSVNESIISGESFAAEKTVDADKTLYQGTTINTGKCTAQVTATGNQTVLGKLGKSVGVSSLPKTILQVQINRLVRYLAIFGLAGLFIIFFLNYLHHDNWATSLLFALTLALSAVPEEIPVAFSSFMALGAYKMSKLGIISRQPQIIENLGAVSVICLDKTGTLTENKMAVKVMYDYSTGELVELQEKLPLKNEKVLFYAMLASERDPFDAMEKGIVEACVSYTGKQFPENFKMIHEYSLKGQPPMMTHVYEAGNSIVVAGKGAAERILQVCRLQETEHIKITGFVKSLAAKGFRVIAIASASPGNKNFPEHQDDFNWQFEGLLALYDPPKKNIAGILRQFSEANINVKILTGDYPETAIHLAGEIGISNYLRCITGNEVTSMTESELKAVIKNTNVFARMFPDAKVKIVNALKESGDIVAMTGDGVNDGPALKAANIGIAMGKKGTQIAQQASDLVITDDNLDRIITAIREGRKIYINLKKAIRYIISIHIPIILLASLPVIIGWAYPNIFTPIHVIFLELIMGPTCSIFFEKEPVEENTMIQLPRKKSLSLFTANELLISVTQGIIIAASSLMVYYLFMDAGASLEKTRTVVFITLILSNIFLTFANRSFTKSIWFTIRYKNSLAPLVLVVSLVFLAMLLFIPFFRELFQLVVISPAEFLLCFAISFASVVWFEIYKLDLPESNGN